MELAASATRRNGIVRLIGALVLVACGCGEQVERSERGTSGGGDRPSAPKAAPKAAAQADTLSFKDDDFVESEHNRDPFREYSSAFRMHGAEVEADVQRTVIMPTTAVESMKLIAIISGMPRPKAMLVDPLGVGYVVERGDYIGRPKVLQASGSVSMTLNWRVDRIRENEVVLTRQDPTDPTRPPLSRIITLRQELAAK
jgi:type IV pilus assembly protein PilP